MHYNFRINKKQLITVPRQRAKKLINAFYDQMTVQKSKNKMISMINSDSLKNYETIDNVFMNWKIF